MGHEEQAFLGQLDVQNALLTYLNGPIQGTGATFPQGINLEHLGFQGTITPEAGPFIEQGLSQVAAIPGSPQEIARQQALQRIVGGEVGTGGDAFNPELRERFFREQVSDPAMQEFNRNVAPNIANRFLSRGQTGAAMRELAQAGAQLTGQLSGQRAGLLRNDENLMAQAREAALNRLLPGVGASQQHQVNAVGTQFAAGDLDRTIRGQFNSERLNRLLGEQPFSDPRLALFPLAQGIGTAAPAPQASGLGGLLSTVGSIGPAALDFFKQNTPAGGFF